MNERMKYLNLFVLLAFTAGQVQYAYTSYFCTMEHKSVQRPTMTNASVTDNDGDACEECQGVIPQAHGQQLIESNCIKVIFSEKSTIDSFAEWGKIHSHFEIALGLIQTNVYTKAVSHQSFSVTSSTNSPPLDLPTLNSNLRI